MAAPLEGFDVMMLREDRAAVSRSHMQGERRREADELLHLQLLDLALLSQAPTPSMLASTPTSHWQCACTLPASLLAHPTPPRAAAAVCRRTC